MAIVSQTNKGFSMMEMLLCMIAMSALMVLSLSSIKELDLDHYYFLNNYLKRQSEAIRYTKNVSIGKGIEFNGMGHVNQAKTIDYSNHSIIIHLGNGYVTLK